MTGAGLPVSADWLELREPADAAARSPELVDLLRRRLPAAGPLVAHDLACGTGSMGRWLAPLLAGAQRWVAHDWDDALLHAADSDPPGPAADGAPVALETRRSDLTGLRPGDLAGADLITASALLDLMTADQLTRLVEVCAAEGCPVLLTLSFDGRAVLDPADPLDARIAAAFNDHQRRVTAAGRLLSSDAVQATISAFRRLGADVVVRPSPWRLGAGQADLAVEWLSGWAAAAREQDRDLADEADAYIGPRLAQARAGRLAVTVGHSDLLALP